MPPEKGGVSASVALELIQRGFFPENLALLNHGQAVWVKTCSWLYFTPGEPASLASMAAQVPLDAVFATPGDVATASFQRKAQGQKHAYPSTSRGAAVLSSAAVLLPLRKLPHQSHTCCVQRMFPPFVAPTSVQPSVWSKKPAPRTLQTSVFLPDWQFRPGTLTVSTLRAPSK